MAFTIIDGLKDRLKKLDGMSVDVGWFEGNKYPDGTPVALVAAWLEFGTKYRPATPFIRHAMIVGRPKIQKAVGKFVKEVINNKMTPENALGLVGHVVEGEILMSIKTGPWPRESEETVKRKGFSAPLRDTKQLMQTLIHKVNTK